MQEHPFSSIFDYYPSKNKGVFQPTQPNPPEVKHVHVHHGTKFAPCRELPAAAKGRDTPRTWMAYGYQTMHACIMRMEWDTGILSWLLMGSTI